MVTAGRGQNRPATPSRAYRDPSGPLGAPPRASSHAVSKSMKSNRGRGTWPELRLRHALRASGLKEYRVNWPGAPGRPDIVFPSSGLAVFVNGCFWHRCPRCNLPLPSTNREFWERKFLRNVNRDARKIRALRRLGWVVLVVWECELEKSSEAVTHRIQRMLGKRRRPRPAWT